MNKITSFGYVPDYRGKSFVKDFYLKIFGYPYPPRRNEVSIVFKILNPKKNERILDIGCGDGVWYTFLKRKGIEVVGIDSSGHDLDKLKERAQKLNLIPEVVEASAQKMPFQSETFDKAYSVSVFEHIENDKEVFRETARVLKPGGLFVISVPLERVPLLIKMAVKLPKRLKNLFCSKLVIEANNQKDFLENFNKFYFHYRNYTIADLMEKTKECGFKIEKTSYNCRFFGSFIWSLYHTLKIFEREKSPVTDYRFRNETAFALVAPLFYPLFLIDRLLFWVKGQIIILLLKKEL